MPKRPVIEIRHFRTFLVVAETENFTRAAERLQLSQPAISQQVKELERELGGLLFRRAGARVRLTPAGRELRERAARLLGRFDQACLPLEREGAALQGHLDVGVIPALGLAWIPPALARLARSQPGLSVTLHERHSSEVETGVESGRFDLGIGLLSHSATGLGYERLAAGEMVALVPARHALARVRSVSLEQLAQLRLALLPPEFLLRQLVDEAFRRARLRPRVGFELDDIDALVATSLRCSMPTLLPSVVLEGRGALALRSVPIRRWTERFEFGLMWPGARERGSPAERFAQALREHLSQRPRRSRRA